MTSIREKYAQGMYDLSWEQLTPSQQQCVESLAGAEVASILAYFRQLSRMESQPAPLQEGISHWGIHDAG